MANEEHVKILRKGVSVWNKWRADNPDILPELDYIDLSGQRLYIIGPSTDGINFQGANLQHANFHGSDLAEVDFRSADLSSADLSLCYMVGVSCSKTIFTGADLYRSLFTWANLSHANFRDAKLQETNLSHSRLEGTIFTGCNMIGTILGAVDLSRAEGLSEVIHHAPSIIGMETIIKSHGQIPRKFLLQAGVPEVWIDYFPSLIAGMEPIQFQSCFISYSNKDKEFAQRIYEDLREKRVPVWFAPQDMKIGDPIRPTIDRQIRLRDKLLVILSENSIKSEWVGDEVEGALEEEQKGNRTVLFPIRLDDTVLNTRDDWAAKIKRRRHIGDFSNWQDKVSYQKAFERLLRDLKATG